MHNAIRSYEPEPVRRVHSGLLDIAQQLGVPVVVAVHCDEGVATHSDVGLDLDVNWAQLAQAIDHLCANGAVMVANVEGHDQLGQWAAPLVASDIRFLVALPLRDDQARRIGCIAALASQAFVARRGISVSRLGELGREFARL